MSRTIPCRRTGDVCGYCQSGTTCRSHGPETLDNGGTSCGSDTYGQILCDTVMWQVHDVSRGGVVRNPPARASLRAERRNFLPSALQLRSERPAPMARPLVLFCRERRHTKGVVSKLRPSSAQTRSSDSASADVNAAGAFESTSSTPSSRPPGLTIGTTISDRVELEHAM